MGLLNELRSTVMDLVDPQPKLLTTPATPKPRLEYRTVKLEAATIRGAARKQERLLNKMSDDGWTLVSETGKHGVAYGTRKNLTFSRPAR